MAGIPSSGCRRPGGETIEIEDGVQVGQVARGEGRVRPIARCFTSAGEVCGKSVARSRAGRRPDRRTRPSPGRARRPELTIGTRRPSCRRCYARQCGARGGARGLGSQEALAVDVSLNLRPPCPSIVIGWGVVAVKRGHAAMAAASFCGVSTCAAGIHALRRVAWVASHVPDGVEHDAPAGHGPHGPCRRAGHPSRCRAAPARTSPRARRSSPSRATPRRPPRSVDRYPAAPARVPGGSARSAWRRGRLVERRRNTDPTLGAGIAVAAAVLGVSVAVGAGVAAPPTTPPRWLLFRNAAPRTTAATTVAAASPNRAPADALDSMMKTLSRPGRGRTCRTDGSCARIASRMRSGNGVTPSNASR